MPFTALKASSNQLQLALSVLPFEISKASHDFPFCLVLQPIIWPEDWYLGIHGMLTRLSNPSRFGAEALLHFTTCLKNRPSSSLDGLHVIHSDCGENIQRLLMGRENLQKTCEMGKTVFSCPLSFAVPFPELLFPLLPPRPFSEPWPIPTVPHHLHSVSESALRDQLAPTSQALTVVCIGVPPICI